MTIREMKFSPLHPGKNLELAARKVGNACNSAGKDPGATRGMKRGTGQLFFVWVGLPVKKRSTQVNG